VHKAQGSEWRNVIVALHDSARHLIYRELLYTAMTRAMNRLDIIAHKHTLDRAVRNPRIKGNSLEDKLEFFASGYLDLEVPLIPGEHTND
jgi:exodeoxyribonuclease V alpha subunit